MMTCGRATDPSWLLSVIYENALVSRILAGARDLLYLGDAGPGLFLGESGQLEKIFKP